MPRFHIVFALVACALVSMPEVEAAELSQACRTALSGQRLTVIVPSTPGGGYDIYARALAPVMESVAGLSAKVVNLPAAGGLMAVTTLADSAPEDLAIMVEGGTEVFRTHAKEGDAPWSERVDPLAVFYAEPSAWLGKSGVAFLGSKDLVAVGNREGQIEADLVGAALGMTFKFISGYSGSKEKEGAVLRGEADLVSFSLTTSVKTVKAGDLEMKLLLSGSANSRAPGVPHIAGEDGLAATLAKDLPAEERARRMSIAANVVNISYDVRTVFTHRSLSPNLRQCLSETVSIAIRSPDFVKTAEEQGRPVAPLEPAQAEALFQALIKSIAEMQSFAKAQ